eukprot:scaffold2003_cov119-Isochrysis_galbana.AAC.2
MASARCKRQVPETGHGPHRRDFSQGFRQICADVAADVPTLCSSGFLEPRTSRKYIFSRAHWPLAQKRHCLNKEKGWGDNGEGE